MKPSVVGVLGAGQLGRMLGLAAIPLGVQCRLVWDAQRDRDGERPPAEAVGPWFGGSFADRDALARFADGVDVVTFEWENVPVAAVEFLAERVPVYPPPAALAVAQDRLAEKALFEELGIPVGPYRAIRSAAELSAALDELGAVCILKTCRNGYDGKGQAKIGSPTESAAAWNALGRAAPLILETRLPFDRELSLIAVRGRDGACAFYPLVENVHEHGILRRSRAPADVSADLQRTAERCGRAVLERLQYVGVLAIEFFDVGGRLLANEMAPRVHNSGHWTIEGADCSQFANHLRAVLGWPLGAAACRGVSVMFNLLGSAPDFAALLNVPQAHLHWYGKSPVPGRKLGHVTVAAGDAESLHRICDSLPIFGR